LRGVLGKKFATFPLSVQPEKAVPLIESKLDQDTAIGRFTQPVGRRSFP
jgi:hypothetical protein